VRACDEIAGFHAIDFVRRGFEGTIGAEYLRRIEDSECTGCGACVQLCPVGALVEKRLPRRVHSAPLRAVSTHCGECPVGCDLLLEVEPFSGRVVRVGTDLDLARGVSFGNACARGRLAPLALSENRLTQPLLRLEDRLRPAGWGEFLDKVAALLSSAKGLAVLASGNLATEDLRALEDLAQAVPGTVLSVPGAAPFVPLWQTLEERWGRGGATATLGELREADLVLILDGHLDERQPVLTSWIRLGMRTRGTRVLGVGGDLGRLARGDALHLPASRGYGAVLSSLLDALRDGGRPPSDPALAAAVDALKGAKRPVALVGPGAAGDARAVVELLEVLGPRKLIPLYEEANVQGALSLGLRTSPADAVAGIRRGDVDAVVAVGVDPLDWGLTASDLEGPRLVLLHHAQPKSLPLAHAAGPLPAWPERTGTFSTLTGVDLRWRPAALPPGEARPLPWVLEGVLRRRAAR